MGLKKSQIRFKWFDKVIFWVLPEVQIELSIVLPNAE